MPRSVAEAKDIKIKLAGQVILIENCSSYLKDYCQDFLAEGAEESGDVEDLRIRVAAEDLEFEQKRSAEDDIRCGRNVREISSEYLESLAVYRKIAEVLPERKTLLFHGSALAVDGQGYLFTAKSGTGKSTHAALWRQCFGDRVVMINDDKPLLQVTDEGVYVCGTPWNGKHRLGCNRRVPLKAVCILERAEENRICRISHKEAWPILLQQSYRSERPEGFAQTLKLLDSIRETTAFYRLGCNMEPEAARLAYETLSGE